MSLLGVLLAASRKDGKAELFEVLGEVTNVTLTEDRFFVLIRQDYSYRVLKDHADYLNELLKPYGIGFGIDFADREERERKERIARLNQLSGGRLTIKQ